VELSGTIEATGFFITVNTNTKNHFYMPKRKKNKEPATANEFTSIPIKFNNSSPQKENNHNNCYDRLSQIHMPMLCLNQQ
jgi:hypothetical protein